MRYIGALGSEFDFASSHAPVLIEAIDALSALNRARTESEEAAHLRQLAEDDMRKRHRRQWLILAVLCSPGLLLAGIQLAVEQGWL